MHTVYPHGCRFGTKRVAQCAYSFVPHPPDAPWDLAAFCISFLPARNFLRLGAACSPPQHELATSQPCADGAGSANIAARASATRPATSTCAEKSEAATLTRSSSSAGKDRSLPLPSSIATSDGDEEDEEPSVEATLVEDNSLILATSACDELGGFGGGLALIKCVHSGM